jgi:hypothetical protein
MSIEAVKVFTVICDSCGKRHHAAGAASVVEGRVSAGIAGWGWRPGKTNSKVIHQRRSIDWCPDCTEELATKAGESGPLRA